MVLGVLGAAAAGVAVGIVTAQHEPALAAPTDVTITQVTDTSVAVSWRGDGGDSFVVRTGSDTLLGASATTVTTTRRALVIDGLATDVGGERYLRVDARRGDEWVRSAVETFRLAPGTPSGLEVVATSRTKAELRWQPAANVTQYDVMRATDDAFTEATSLGRTSDAATSLVVGRLEPGTRYFFKLRAVNGPGTGTYSAPVSTKTLAPDLEFNAGTFNVCSEKCSRYARRARLAKTLLTQHEIDVFGLQEAGGERVGATTNAIFSGGPRGYVRAHGGAQARYIFYRPALFDQLDGGHFALGHGRYATWALLRSTASRSTFYFTSTHLISGKSSRQDARRARETRDLIRTMRAMNTKGYPVVHVGDFNSNADRKRDAPAEVMTAAGLLDSRFASEREPVNAAINSGHTFSTRVPRTGVNVDYIWVTPEIDVLAWEQLVRIRDGRYVTPIISDHNALKATLSITSRAPSIGQVADLTPVPMTVP